MSRQRNVALLVIALAVASAIGCGRSSDASSDAVAGDDPSQTAAAECSEPENPYNDGGGHDAGFNWAQENGGACTGNGDSFDEGCDEFNRQNDEYETCVATTQDQ